jgi:hypothetical protein
MTELEKSLGKAIDEIVNALKGLNDASRLVALKAASEYLGLSAPAVSGPTISAQLATAIPAAASIPTPITDIKTLKEAKKPASAIEMACIVGFYLQELAPPSERKTETTVSDIDKYFRQAGYPLPKAQRQLLTDAKISGYFDSPSRGVYKLNAVGYNLVAHRLPRDASTSLDSQTPTRRRGTSRKTSRSKKK